MGGGGAPELGTGVGCAGSARRRGGCGRAPVTARVAGGCPCPPRSSSHRLRATDDDSPLTPLTSPPLTPTPARPAVEVLSDASAKKA